MDFTRGSSSVFRIELHISYKVKYCRKIFDFIEVKQRCEQIFHEVAALHGVEITELGFDGDHVHGDIKIRITHRVSDINKAFKGTSGRKLLTEFPFLKKQYFWGSGLWGRQAYVDSVGRDPQQIREYVKNQGKNRQTVSLAKFLNTTSL